MERDFYRSGPACDHDRERPWPAHSGNLEEARQYVKHPWVVTAREPQAGAPTILCFPHAGGTVLSVAQLLRHLPMHLGVRVLNLPGREGSDAHPPLRRATTAAAAIAAKLAAGDSVPEVFLGNSYGALLAYETARVLVRSGRAEPRLMVSGFRSPLLAAAEASLFAAPRAFLRSELAARFGVGGEELAALEHYEVALRADLEACETYRHAGEICLKRRIEVLALTDDPAVTASDLMAWKGVSAGGAMLHEVRGQHFCWAHQAGEVATEVQRLLDTTASCEAAKQEKSARPGIR
jgi:surfactin synthase thioesterase subunit